MSDERPGRPSGRTLALLTLVGTMVSIQFGASLARGSSPPSAPRGTTALRLLLAAAVLWVVWRPWRTRLAVGAARALGLYDASLGCMMPSSFDYLCFLLRRAAKPRAATEKRCAGAASPPPRPHQAYVFNRI